MRRTRRTLAALLVVAAPALAGAQAPSVDHHKHLMSPAAAELESPRYHAGVTLPPELERLLRAREQAWNVRADLAPLYTPNALLFEYGSNNWIRGRDEIARRMAARFLRRPTLLPFDYAVDGNQGRIVGYFTVGAADSLHRFGQFHWSVERGGDGAWRVAAESPTFPAPARILPVTAERLIAELDSAGIRRAVVMSVGYWFGEPGRDPALPNARAMVEAENDWTAREVARYPDRLVAFCSVAPLDDWAPAEIERCARTLGMRGLKLHFGNSRVDVRNPEHVRKVRAVFAAANRNGLAIAAHMWVRDPDYGAEHARIFLEQLLPQAPDVVVQVAHFAGGGPGFNDAALGVLADAVAAKDQRTRNLYFDLATVADRQTPAALAKLAERIRQVGVERVLWGSDLHIPGPNANPVARLAWKNFREIVPLTPAELAAIAANVAPYMK